MTHAVNFLFALAADTLSYRHFPTSLSLSGLFTVNPTFFAPYPVSRHEYCHLVQLAPPSVERVV
jgi:hypothetical protein